jgi:purine-binding chemotaxis protein CheW
MTTNRYLCFNAGTQEFAIPLLSIKEVIGLPEITPLPQAPNYFKGIMNLRGQILSVVDLRIKIGVKPQSSEETTVIIVDCSDVSLGMIVDKVNAVLDIDPSEISPKPIMEGGKNHDYVTGIYHKDDKIILLVDLVKALSLQDHNDSQQNHMKA